MSNTGEKVGYLFLENGITFSRVPVLRHKGIETVLPRKSLEELSAVLLLVPVVICTIKSTVVCHLSSPILHENKTKQGIRGIFLNFPTSNSTFGYVSIKADINEFEYLFSSPNPPCK